MSVPQPAPAARTSLATRVLVVIGIVALVLVGLRIVSAVYDRATREDRWQESAARSCSIMVALIGGEGALERLTVTEPGPRVADTPQYVVTGATVGGQHVRCINSIKQDGTATASSVFLLDGTKVA